MQMYRALSAWLHELHHYWKRDACNVFRNALDAVGGLIVLIIIPCVALIVVICQATSASSIIFASFSYPVITLSLSGIYDALGRLPHLPPNAPKEDVSSYKKQENSTMQVKIWIRIVVDILVCTVGVALSFASEISVIHIFPILLLIANGILLLGDIIRRIRTRIQMYLIVHFPALKGVIESVDEERYQHAENTSTGNTCGM